MSIYSIISDSDINSELTSCFKNRTLEQKFLYHWKWAELYYEYKDNKDVLMSHKEDVDDINLINFWLKNCFRKWDNVTLISLWCWNWWVEKEIFKSIPEGVDVDYIWVDLSKEMLNLANKNLAEINIDKKFVCADFSSIEFKNEIDSLVKDGKKRIFSFFSNTFWNINHTNIIDTLYDILDSWEQIWLDVRLRKSMKVKDDMDIFNLVNIDWKDHILDDFLSNVFVKNNIPKDNGYISKVMKKENGINSLKVEFYFNFKEKTKIKMKGHITFLPWERIKCLQIYYYDADSLIKFFNEHNFKLIDKEIKWMRWQFLFEKE